MVRINPIFQDKAHLDELEQKLNYQDIRFYRSIARSELRKERVSHQTAQQKDLQQGPEGKGQSGSTNKSGWLGWMWGGKKAPAHQNDDQPQDLLSDEQRKELYDAIDWDERQTAATNDTDLAKDAIKMRVKAILDTGSFALRRDPHGKAQDMVKVVFENFSANALQRPENLEAILALGGMSVYDGTKPDTLHKQIVKVKQTSTDTTVADGGFIVDPNDRPSDGAMVGTSGSGIKPKDERNEEQQENPFFYVKFEQNPLDERADTGLTVKLRYMEIIYHKGYVEEIVRFFKPPASQLESIHALVDAASGTLENIRKETRAGLELALQQHKTVDVRVDMNAPIIVIPEDVAKETCQHIVLDAGHISVESELVDKQAVTSIRNKEHQNYDDEDFERLEALMYDRYHIKLESAQLLMGNTLQACMDCLSTDTSPQIHILERINMGFKAETCIVAKAPNLTRFRITGDLPDLHIHFSDRKYKNLMRMIDVALPKFDDAANTEVSAGVHMKQPKAADAPATTIGKSCKAAPLYLDDDALSLGEETDVDFEDDKIEGAAARSKHERKVSEGHNHKEGKDKETGDDEFFDPGDIIESVSSTGRLATAITLTSTPLQNANFRQKSFEFVFTVTSLQVSIYKSDVMPEKPDRLLVETILNSFNFAFALRPYDMQVAITLAAFSIEDKMVEKNSIFQQLVGSDVDEKQMNGKDLVSIKYSRVQSDSPEFMTVHEGNNQASQTEFIV